FCLFDCSRAHPHLHSFPTRRSSDLHLLPPAWRSFCSSRRFLNSSISLSSPPSDWICARSSSLRLRSNSLRSHSSGISASRCSSRDRKEHTSELQSRENLVCRLLLEK